jgi:hypothetical protein
MALKTIQHIHSWLIRLVKGMLLLISTLQDRYFTMQIRPSKLAENQTCRLRNRPHSMLKLLGELGVGANSCHTVEERLISLLPTTVAVCLIATIAARDHWQLLIVTRVPDHDYRPISRSFGLSSCVNKCHGFV